MRISHRYHFTFLAYPRTASKSVREVLDPFSDIKGVHPTKTGHRHPFAQHMPARDAKQVFDQKGWDWFGYRSFCVVRNPYARVVSLFNHHESMRTRRAPGLALIPRLKALVKYRLERPLSFKEYVLGLGKWRGMTMPLQDFICDGAGNRLVNDVLKFEDLAVELPRYLHQLGIQIEPEEIPVLGASGIGSYKEYYDAETQGLVENLYRYEIDAFGYSFEDLE